MPDQDRPDVAAGRNGEAERNHHRAEDHGETDAGALRHPTHQDAAGAGAEPGQGAGQRYHLAGGAEILGDRLQSDHDQERRTVGYRQQGQGDAGGDPRAARLDARRARAHRHDRGRCRLGEIGHRVEALSHEMPGFWAAHPSDNVRHSAAATADRASQRCRLGHAIDRRA